MLNLSKGGMNTSHNNYDPIREIILSRGLRIESIHILEKRMLIFLNSHQVLIDSIDNHERLKNASLEQLKDFRLISNGTGIQWPALDEDLSLYGFLKDYITKNFQERKELVIV